MVAHVQSRGNHFILCNIQLPFPINTYDSHITFSRPFEIIFAEHLHIFFNYCFSLPLMSQRENISLMREKNRNLWMKKIEFKALYIGENLIGKKKINKSYSQLIMCRALKYMIVIIIRSVTLSNLNFLKINSPKYYLHIKCLIDDT